MPAAKYQPGEYINGVLFVENVPKTDAHRRGMFKCPFCDSLFNVLIQAIVSKNTISCGCQMRKRDSKHGHNKTTKTRSSEYESWNSMKDRCLNKKSSNYRRYGAVGITVCDRWLDFNNFIKDMGCKPSPKHSIDRFPNNKGNYEPGNCRWATAKEQTRNRENTVHLTYNGLTKPMACWAEALKLSYGALSYRRKMGKSVSEILRTKVPPPIFLNHSFGVVNN